MALVSIKFTSDVNVVQITFNYWYCYTVVMCGQRLTDNQISEESRVVKNKEPVVKNKMLFSTESILVQKQTGIQLKGGAVFCLPAKSSHSSRIIIPNKRFLEDDYHKYEISPKKPKVEPLSTDVKKATTVTVPSTYRCSLGTRKRSKSDSKVTGSDVPCRPEIGEEVGGCESDQTKHDTLDVDKQDLKSESKNDKPDSVTAETVEQDSVKSKSVTDSSESISVTCVDTPPVTPGSILQKPKLCLDQTELDRSKLEFAKSLRNQMAQETQSEMSDVVHVGRPACSSSTAGTATGPEVCSVNTLTQNSNITPSSTCSSWNSRTGTYNKL